MLPTTFAPAVLARLANSPSGSRGSAVDLGRITPTSIARSCLTVSSDRLSSDIEFPYHGLRATELVEVQPVPASQLEYRPAPTFNKTYKPNETANPRRKGTASDNIPADRPHAAPALTFAEQYSQTPDRVTDHRR